MKKYQIVLAVLAVMLVLCSSIGGALAYFSDRDIDQEILPIIIDNIPTIDERFDADGNKIVTIQNQGTAPVFMRFKVEASEIVKVSMSGSNWGTPESIGLEADGYLYYTVPLAAGETASELTVTVTLPTYANEEAAHKAGEEAHVAVLYESVPAIFTGTAGTPDFLTAWERGTVTVVS